MSARVSFASPLTVVLVTRVLLLYACLAAENPIPAALDAQRYTHLSAHCPFALATATVPASPAQPSFAANWYVSGIARIDNVDFVTIKSRDLSTQFSLFGQETDAKNQVTLVTVEWVEGIGKSKVIVRKGGETATLEFNEAEVHGAAQQPGGGGSPSGGTAPGGTGTIGGPGSKVTPRPAGMPPIPIGPANGNQPQRYLKTVAPPTPITGPTPLPSSTARSPYQPGTGVPRRLPPGLPRTATPGTQMPR
jgi:hypothetical protein